MKSKPNGSRDWSSKQVFTTGEAGEICNLSQQTIIRCFDTGRLQGFRVPGSRFRRIPRAELLRFMQQNDIPLGALESAMKRVLIVDDDERILDLCRSLLGADERFEVRTASTGYDAGLLTEQFRPHLILLDYRLPDVNGHLVCQRIRSMPELRDTKILVVSGGLDQGDIERLAAGGADGMLEKPIDVTVLLSHVEDLLGV